MAELRQNTWSLDEWYDQNVAGTTGGYNSNGILFSWGGGIVGGLGQNNLTDLSSPTQVGTDSTWSDNRHKLAAGYRNANAIKGDGTLWTWGQDGYGQLGINLGSGNISSPVQVGTDTTWASVTRGYEYGMATKTDGTLWTWGRNNNGVLGQGNRTGYSSPIQVPGTWKKDARFASAGPAVNAVKADGTLWSWGYQNQGQLGLNEGTSRYSSPTQIGTDTTWSHSVRPGGDITGAIKTDGTLWLWGRNYYGMLGQNQSNNSLYHSSPTQLPGSWSQCSLNNAFGIATKTDGTLWAWGNNQWGMLGQNQPNLTRQSSPVQIGTGTTWSGCDRGWRSFYAIKTDGTLWGWGQNERGQLGQNSIMPSSPSWDQSRGYSSPAQIPGTWAFCATSGSNPSPAGAGNVLGMKVP